MPKFFTINVIVDDFEVESEKDDYSEESYKEHCKLIENIFKNEIDYLSFVTPQGKVFIPGELLKKSIITLRTYDK